MSAIAVANVKSDVCMSMSREIAVALSDGEGSVRTESGENGRNEVLRQR